MSISALNSNTSLVQDFTGNKLSDSQQKIQNLERQKNQLQNEIRLIKENRSLDEEAKRKKIEELEKKIKKIKEQISKLKQNKTEDKNISQKNEEKEKRVRDPYSTVGLVFDEIV